MNCDGAFASADVRTTVLASGTLSPMHFVATELRHPFAHRLQATHVVDLPRQVCALSRGPSAMVLVSPSAEQQSMGWVVSGATPICLRPKATHMARTQVRERVVKNGGIPK